MDLAQTRNLVTALNDGLRLSGRFYKWDGRAMSVMEWVKVLGGFGLKLSDM